MPVSLVGKFGNLLGPYEKWMFDIGKRFDLPGLMLDKGVSLSCVAEFETAVSYGDFVTASKTIQSDQACYWIILPTLYKNGFNSRFLPFVVDPAREGMPNAPQTQLLNQTAEKVQAFFAAFAVNQQAAPPVAGKFRANFPIRAETMGSSDLTESQTEPVIDPALNGAAPKVILAAIDLGIPFAHARFRHPGSLNTRLDYCWSQTAPADPAHAGEVLFGREFRRAQIDAMVQDSHGDEEEIYRRAGLLGQPDGPPLPLGRASTHGAHVFDLMAGDWPAESAAETRLIAVDLPSSSVWETSGFGKDMFVLSALHYIFDRADRIRDAYGCGDLPLVINLSYGFSGGPHDGSSLIEAALEEMISFRNSLAPTLLVMPSGNSFQDRLYAQITGSHFTAGDTGKSAQLQWFAPPGDRTSSFVEIWYPPGSTPDDLHLSVTPPGQSQSVTLRRQPADGTAIVGHLIALEGKIVGQITSDLHRGSRWRAMVILAPSDTDPVTVDGQTYGAAPAGIWSLRFELPVARVLPGGIECRIQRDTSFGQGNTGAQQSYFLDPKLEPFTPEGRWNTQDQTATGAMVRRFGSLNGMATGVSTVVVGGAVQSTGQAAAYSGAGGEGAGKAVTISAPTERSAMALGVVAAGSRSGTRFALSGTSSAAPQVARLLAEALAASAARGQTAEALLTSRPGVKAVTKAGPGPEGKLRLGANRLSPPTQPDKI